MTTPSNFLGENPWPGGLREPSSGGLPLQLRNQLRSVHALASSETFLTPLERLLGLIGGRTLLGIWLPHTLCYLATWAVIVRWVSIDYLFPRGRYETLTIQLLASYAFTTFMLWELRRIRSTAIRAVSAIEAPEIRLNEVRRCLGPMQWGWSLKLPFSPGIGRKRGRISPLVLVFAILAIHYVHIPWFDWTDKSQPLWSIYYPEVVGFYNNFCKAAMMVGVLSQFSTLAALARILRGDVRSALSPVDRSMIADECRTSALRIAIGVGAATGLWMAANRYDYGISYWSYLFSFLLAVIFVVETALAREVKLLPFAPDNRWARLWAQAVASVRNLPSEYSPVPFAAALIGICCPIISQFVPRMLQ